jgi:sulfur-carrier protein
MAVEVRVPRVLREHVGGASSLTVEAGPLKEVIAGITATHPGLRQQLMASGGEFHRFINVYVNDEDVRFLEGLETKVSDGDVVAILPAVAGGS